MLKFDGIEFNNTEPIYLQIVELIKKAITAGDLLPGEKLPSVREMSSILGVNPNTLQRAYGELEREGITYTKRGMGSFVNGTETNVNQLKHEMAKTIVLKFLTDLKAAGINKDEALKLIEEMEIND